jgi:hypothetical protein
MQLFLIFPRTRCILNAKTSLSGSALVHPTFFILLSSTLIDTVSVRRNCKNSVFEAIIDTIAICPWVKKRAVSLC